MTEHSVNKTATAVCDDERRKLLKASAAVPLIATLSPNSAVAMQSLTCDMKVDYRPTDEGVLPADTLDPKSFIRVPAELWAPGYDSDLPVLYKINDGRFVYASNGQPVPENDLPDSNDYPTKKSVRLASYFNVTPDYEGSASVSGQGFFPQDQNGGQPLAASCLCSIDPDGPAGQFYCT